MGALDGQGALVTGGSRGIGRAIVKRLAADRTPAGSAGRTWPPTAACCPDPSLPMSTMDQWTAAVCADLGLDPSSADLRAVLDLTRDVAHGVARPAAPLTAYLVGVAVGRGLALPDAAGRVAALAASWEKEEQ